MYFVNEFSSRSDLKSKTTFSTQVKGSKEGACNYWLFYLSISAKGVDKSPQEETLSLCLNFCHHLNIMDHLRLLSWWWTILNKYLWLNWLSPLLWFLKAYHPGYPSKSYWPSPIDDDHLIVNWDLWPTNFMIAIFVQRHLSFFAENHPLSPQLSATSPWFAHLISSGTGFSSDSKYGQNLFSVKVFAILPGARLPWHSLLLPLHSPKLFHAHHNAQVNTASTNWPNL